MVIDSAKGMIAWRPTIEQIGAHDVIVRATDGTGSTALHAFHIDVSSPDAFPVITTKPTQKAFVGRAYVQDFAAQDAENGPIVWSIISGPAGSVIDGSTGRLTWTPTSGAGGQANFTLAAKDSKGNQATASFAVEVVNQSPNLFPLSIQLPRNSASPGSEYRSQIRARDALGRPVTWSLTAGPSGFLISAEGRILWTPRPEDIGTRTLQLLATTVDGLTQSVNVDVEVTGWITNSTPVITSTPIPTAIAGQLYVVPVEVTDADRDQLSFVLLNAPLG